MAKRKKKHGHKRHKKYRPPCVGKTVRVSGKRYRLKSKSVKNARGSKRHMRVYASRCK